MWGARGSENSELLRHLRSVDRWPGPRAFLDGEQLPARLRPHQVASRLAFQLGYEAEGFGRARFPRFFLGLAAVREPLNPDAGAGAREARRDLLNQRLRNRSEGRTWLRDSAAAIAGLAGLDGAVTSAVGLAVDGLVEITRTLRLLRGPAMTWYRDILDVHFQDPVDGVVELSVQEFLGNHNSVDEVLCRAFVADLRHEFDASHGWNARETSAVALLDNVGRPAASRFLAMLAELEDNSGPLLVVAASHLRFPPAAAEDPASWQPDALSEVSISRWAAQRAARGGSRYYPVWVDPVDEVPATAEPDRQEVETILRGLEPGETRRAAVSLAHRLTAGHPAGLEMVIETLRRGGGLSSAVAEPQGFDLRGTLDLEHLDDTVFDLVLGPWTEDMRGGLALMAIAVDLSDHRIAPILGREPTLVAELITDFRARDLWVTHRVVGGAMDPPRLHPFARRAIAHRLGRPGGIAALDLRWDQAHEVLRNAAAENGDDLALLYHELALGRFSEVAQRLSDMFDSMGPERWYELLLQVTAAPLARPYDWHDAGTHLDKLSEGPAPEPKVTRKLLAALLLHSDPLGDPHHDMCGIVAAELGELRRHGGQREPFLVAQGQRFRQCWSRWHAGLGAS